MRILNQAHDVKTGETIQFYSESDPTITEAEGIERDKAEQAKAEARAAEKAALRAKVSALAKEPPRPQDLAQALSDLAKAVEALT